MRATGTVEKISRRFGMYRVLLFTSQKRIIADFDAAPDTKLRQGAEVSIEGEFRSEGRDTVCLEQCRLLTD
jgi:hypothetical protein